MSDNIRIITRGDDCGSSHSANLGIMEAAKAGLLKNISVMVTCPFIEEAATMFARRTEFCFGLHATLNAEWDAVKWGPVLPPEQIPSLVDEHGMFFPGPHVFRKHPPRMQEILAELQAQLQKARRLGFPITYVDSHMLFELDVDGLEEQMSAWTAQEGLLYHGYYGCPLPKGGPKDDPVEAFISRLEALQPGQYLLHAHPAVDSSELRALGNKDTAGEQLAATRSMDIRLFTDPRVLACYERRHILPLRYDQAERVRSRLPTLDELSR
jgi:chitin disaccharide deacetylase